MIPKLIFHTCVTSTLLFLWVSLAVYACPGPNYGKRCLFPCHCKIQAECLVSGKFTCECEVGWFGLQCQFSDLAPNNSKSQQPTHWALDHDVSTCNPNLDATNFIMVLDRAVYHNWFRLFLNSAERISTVEIFTNGQDKCHILKTGKRAKVFDFFCVSREVYQSVLLSGAAVGDLCDFRVNHGRDLTFLQEGTGPGINAIALVDNDVRTCLDKKSGFRNSHWFLHLSYPAMIHMYVVTSTQDDNEFELQGYGTSGEMVFNCSQTGKSKVEIRIHDPTHRPIISISILTKKPLLNICELQMWGETHCDTNYVGSYCEHICQCENDFGCVPYTGECITHNIVHDRRCPAHCGEGCENSHLWCINCLKDVQGLDCKECKPDRYSEKCDRQCPTGCEHRHCDRTTGRCLVCKQDSWIRSCDPKCPDGRWGDNCDRTCPPHCQDNQCNITNGDCQNCNTSYYLQPCRNRSQCMRGRDCLKCPEHCAGDVCHTDNGHCLHCDPGFHGLRCTPIVVETSELNSPDILLWALLIPGGLCLVSLIVRLCLRFRHAESSAEDGSVSHEGGGEPFEGRNVPHEDNGGPPEYSTVPHEDSNEPPEDSIEPHEDTNVPHEDSSGPYEDSSGPVPRRNSYL